MDYQTLLQKIKSYESTYEVKCIGCSHFGRKIIAVERNLNSNFATAIFVASTHAREHITTDLLCQMLDDNIFDEITDFNISLVLMHNPDGVELACHGIMSVPQKEKQNLLEINGGSLDFRLWKANGKGEDINNNFDARFGTNVHSFKPSSSGYIGKFAEAVPETKALADYTRQKNTFFTVAYHSKGEEIYYNFFQNEKMLTRDSLIASRFAKSTGYKIKNVEAVSSGGYKDWCVSKLNIPALTIEVGADSLMHPILRVALPEIYKRNKMLAKDVVFAYNVFKRFGEN